MDIISVTYFLWIFENKTFIFMKNQNTLMLDILYGFFLISLFLDLIYMNI